MRKLLRRIREWLGFQSIVDFYRSAGSPHPVSDALDELGMRVIIEELRDFVSDEWQNFDTLDEAVDAWRKQHFTLKTKHMDFKKAKTLGKIIREITPGELLHPWAHEAWLNRHEVRRNIGWTELQSRVLRAGA